MKESILIKQWDRRTRQEHLFKVVVSERFLTKQGLGNEVPFFIFPFPAEDGLFMDTDRKGLISRIHNTGKQVLDINLYNLVLDILTERGVLDQVLEIESDHDKSEIMELLQSVLDTALHLVPRIETEIKAKTHDIIFLSGIGEVYPYIRSHNVLNNLQRVTTNAPMVLFFPGEYHYSSATGTSLNLFGKLQDDKYYRAFNILNYEV